MLWKAPVILFLVFVASQFSDWSMQTWQSIGIGMLLFAFLLEWRAASATIRRVDEIMHGRLEASELLTNRIPGTAGAYTLAGVPDAFERLLDELLAAEKHPLAKELDQWGRTIYRVRGSDPKGPAQGVGADTIDVNLPRRDAMTPRPEFEGLEGELTRAEEMLGEANDVAAEKALVRWNEQERADPELVAEGVEKLGDLVAKGHFGGPKASDESTENH